MLHLVIVVVLLNHRLKAEQNGIIGLPQIDCDNSRILITMRTEQPFHGRIFLKGNSHRPECVTDFGDHRLNQNATRMQVAVDYNLCNTERIRQLDPVGITYANSLIVQFHRRFITKGDKAYHMRCFYSSDMEHTVASRFDVSNIPTDSVSHDMEMPQCAYTVRKGSTNGPLVRHARVGDSVVHRWECTGNGESFGMLVHSCFVEDDTGERTPIVDEHGCTMDEFLLPKLNYNSVLDLAYSETKVFKFPDNAFIYFRCQIRICTKFHDECTGVTPPNCESTKTNDNSIGRKVRSVNMNRMSDLDVVTKEMLVLQEGGIDLDTILSEELSTEGMRNPQKMNANVNNSSLLLHFCTNKMLLTTFLMAIVTLLGSLVSFIVYLLIRNRQKHW